MSVPPTAPASTLRPLWPVALAAAVGLAYAFGHLGWYFTTPLGQVPVLDERENLRLAETIFRNTLPAEPFYRASGYALILAALRSLGVSAGGLFSAALALGAVLHAVNAGLVALLARRWFGPAAALAAGLLCALNPVLVHYSTQALDAVPALTLFLAGLVLIAPALAAPPYTGRTARWLGASGCWAAATLMRPNYLLVWAVLPLLAVTGWRTRLGHRHLAASFAGAFLFLAAAFWQHEVSGVAGFMPWQGAYNLWAANQPSSNGRYYTQHVSLPPVLAEKNPSRAESMLLYQQETGRPPTDIAAMNAHWHAKFLGYVVQHPFAWFGQLARKFYALCNDWEQYNNKTFAFHQALSPWLRWNPLSFGILFILGVAGATRLAAQSRHIAASLALITAACAASVLLFFVSARFRLPLAAIATVLAGGAVAAPGFWKTWSPSRQWTLLVVLGCAALLTFSRFDDVRSCATFVQDHALLARAAATTGNDPLAWSESQAALALQPGHPDALRIAVATYFNQLLDDTANPTAESTWLKNCDELLRDGRDDAPDLRAVAILATWRAGGHADALKRWRQLGTTPSALAARALAQDRTVTREDLMSLAPSAWDQPLVRLAAVALGISPPPGIMVDASAATAQTKRLFPTVSPR